MPRLRRYLPPLLLLLPVIFICGKLLLTPVQHWADLHEWSKITHLERPSHLWPQIDVRGWPWSFEDAYNEPTQGGGMILRFSWWSLIADLLVLSSTILGIFLLFAWHRRRQGAWFRFSLREMFLATAGIAIFLGWLVTYHTQCKRQRTQLQALETAGVDIRETGYGPGWFRRMFGDSTFFEHVTMIGIDWEPLHRLKRQDELVSALQAMPVRDCQIDSIEKGLTDADARILEYFETLEIMDLDNIDEIGATFEVLGRLPRLKTLMFRWDTPSYRNLSDLANNSALEEICLGGEINDVSLIALLEFKNLRRLNLANCSISDPEVRKLSQMTQLEELDISFCEAVTDEGLRHLLDMPNLQTLGIVGLPRVSQETVQLLKRNIPQVTLE